VLSEFPLGRQPDKTTFPMRNRIVSGLAMGVLVVEAGLGSGALITVDQALDQGRAVFAVPGRIDSPSSKGTHQLIKNGARLVDSVDDILDEFEFLIPPGKRENAAETAAARPPLLPEEERIVRALEDGEQDLDSLTRATGLGAARVSALVIGLEMKRMVRMQPGRIVELIR
jgi:DNA processing protein